MTSSENNEFWASMVELHVLGRKEHFNFFIFGLSTEIIVM